MNTTKTPKQSEIKREWHLIDLKQATLGRTATKIAGLLMGKGKTYYVPNLDCGDYVICTNAKLVKVTGKKSSDKLYYRHSQYPGGFKVTTFKMEMNKDPRKIIIEAVKGMLPQNKLRDRRLKRLKIFPASEHPYQDKLTTKVTE